MSERELQHGPDDELLSAYLDDELTAEERSAVEERLASDPAARQMLHQLRSVSQSVQALPLEPVGRDLREQTLQRAQALKPAETVRAIAKDIGPSGAGDVPPMFTVFHTRRSWIWASLAVAAGLMITVLYSGDQTEKSLPAVAQHNGGSAKNRSLGETRERATNKPAPAIADSARRVARAEPASPPASAAAKPPASVAAPSRSAVALKQPVLPESSMPLSDESTTASPPPLPSTAGSALKANSESRLARSKSIPAPPQEAAALRPANEGLAAVGTLSEPQGEPRQSAVQRDSLVVVHVVAKPEAFRNKLFDKLLVNNGIAIEADLMSEKEERFSRSAGALSKDAKDKDVGQLADQFARTSAGRDADILLVDAPQTKIESCLAGLQRDAENYIGVAVEAPVAGADRADANAPLEKKLASELRRYNRGIVSQLQEDAYRIRLNGGRDAAEADQPKVNRELGRDAIAEAVRKPPASEPERLAGPESAAKEMGRARRLMAFGAEGTRSGESSARGGIAGGPIATDALTMRRAQSELEKLPDSGVNNVRVLFIVSPDRGPTSGAAAKKAAK
jgi:anti-sigma factor RsiW